MLGSPPLLLVSQFLRWLVVTLRINLCFGVDTHMGLYLYSVSNNYVDDPLEGD